MGKVLFWTLAALCVISCARRPQGTARSVEVGDYGNAAFPDSGLLPSLTRAFRVLPDSSLLPVSDVKDVSMDGEVCYVLDVQSVLTAFSLRDGHIVAQSRPVGRGGGEYISPMAIDAWHDTLYVADAGKRAIVCYDSTLCAIGELPMDDVALDFARVGDEFMMLSLSEEQRLRLSLVDDRGRTVETGPEGRLEADMTSSVCDCIVRDAQGDVFVKIPLEETIYRLEGDGFVPRWEISYRGERTSEDFGNGTAMLHSDTHRTSCFFVRGGDLLISFANKGKLCFSYIGEGGETPATGIVPAHGDDIAFCPRWQSGNTLLSVEADYETGGGWTVCVYQFR